MRLFNLLFIYLRTYLKTYIMGQILPEEHRPEHARRGIEHRNGIPRRRVGELQLCRLHRRAALLRQL